MPGLDGTGPAGRGSGTGRGRGFCGGARRRPGGLLNRPSGMFPFARRRSAGFGRGRRGENGGVAPQKPS